MSASGGWPRDADGRLLVMPIGGGAPLPAGAYMAQGLWRDANGRVLIADEGQFGAPADLPNFTPDVDVGSTTVRYGHGGLNQQLAGNLAAAGCLVVSDGQATGDSAGMGVLSEDEAHELMMLARTDDAVGAGPHLIFDTAIGRPDGEYWYTEIVHKRNNEHKWAEGIEGAPALGNERFFCGPIHNESPFEFSFTFVVDIATNRTVWNPDTALGTSYDSLLHIRGDEAALPILTIQQAAGQSVPSLKVLASDGIEELLTLDHAGSLDVNGGYVNINGSSWPFLFIVDDGATGAGLVLQTAGHKWEAYTDAVGGPLSFEHNDTVVALLGTTGAFISDAAAAGIVLKDTQGTPHYWRVTVTNAGALVTTDLGTTRPTG